MTNTGKCRSYKLSMARAAADKLRGRLNNCSICPRICGVNRTAGKTGYCRAGLYPRVYSYSAHHGEEPPLSGERGSGTIFFSYCNMKCVYCQNYYFSQLDNGQEVSIEKLAHIMFLLQKSGCHNINLVSPAHYVPQIVTALEIAWTNGLDIPIIYNSSGYDSVETIRILDGIIDIYMPDMRYADDDMAKRYSDAVNYVRHNRESIKEMHRQVGDLELDAEGIALKGLIVRLLVLPEDISGISQSLKFIKEDISLGTYLSIMSQYYPTFKAYNYTKLSRGITKQEYQNIVDAAKVLGLNNGWIQEAPDLIDQKFWGTNIPPRES
jgi:putative pyruvate formate lyase activating enzyme